MEREGYQPENAVENLTETIETLPNGTEVIEFKPEELKSETPTLWVGGIATTPESYRPALEALSSRGRDVIAFTDPPEGVKPAHHREMLPTDEQENDLPPAELRRALDLLEVMNAKDAKKVDVVGHSMGGTSAVIAALGAPERFRNIVLIDPVGLDGKHGLPEFLAQLGKSQFSSSVSSFAEGGKVRENYRRYIAEQNNKRYNAEGTKEALKNPGPSNPETLEGTNIDITPILKELHDRGIKISIIHATEDDMFPMKKVQNLVATQDIDDFEPLHGQHEESIVFQSEEVMATADKLLEAMARRSAAEKNETANE